MIVCLLVDLYCDDYVDYSFLIRQLLEQGRIQDFKLGGGALKKIAPSGGRRKHLWGISCEKSQFYAKKSYFFPILGEVRPTPGSAPVINTAVLSVMIYWYSAI